MHCHDTRVRLVIVWMTGLLVSGVWANQAENLIRHDFLPALTPDQLLVELQANAIPRNTTECPQPCGAGLLNAIRDTSPDTVIRVTLRLDPNRKLRNGETTTAIATVTLNSVPRQGVSVTFASDNTGVATVAPATAVTGANGEARSTVTGVSRGDANITATANGVTASQPVEVPDITTIGLLLLALLLITATALRQRRARAAA